MTPLTWNVCQWVGDHIIKIHTNPPIISPPDPPSVCPVCQRVEDGGEPVEGDGDHHETGDVETKDPNERVI